MGQLCNSWGPATPILGPMLGGRLSKGISLVHASNALRLLKTVACALRYLHAEKPPVTEKVTVYNVWLDSSRISKSSLARDSYKSKAIPCQIAHI